MIQTYMDLNLHANMNSISVWIQRIIQDFWESKNKNGCVGLWEIMISDNYKSLQSALSSTVIPEYVHVGRIPDPLLHD